MYVSTTRPDPGAAAAGRVVFSDAARDAIVAACRRGARQAVLLSWPAGATYLPRQYYQPGEFDVVVHHVAGCPVYVDVRRLALFRNYRVLLDAERPSRTRPYPPLRARAIQTSAQPAGEEPSQTCDRLGVVAGPTAPELVEDLVADLAGVHPPNVVRAAAHRAISELRGSVSFEALPEMASRLVRHRLTGNASRTA